MQTIPARLMRAQAEACATRPAPTPRARARRAYILEAGRAIFTAHGRTRVTLRDIAVATGLTQISIRNQIADLDHLFALTLAKYLDEILAAIALVPRHHTDLFARRRAEYFRVTRGIFAVPTPLHFLWMRDRFSLPDDEIEPLEERRHTLGFMLAGDAWETALLLLDSTHLDIPDIETMLEDQAARAQQQAFPDQADPAQAAAAHAEVRNAALRPAGQPPQAATAQQAATPSTPWTLMTKPDALRAKILRASAATPPPQLPATPAWLAAQPPLPTPPAHAA